MCIQCSVTCGQGKTTRQVLCVNFSDQEVNASECDPDDRPTTEQDCAMSQCPSRSSESRPFPSSPNTSTRNNLPRSQSHQWRTGPWGAVRHPTCNSITSKWFISVGPSFLWNFVLTFVHPIDINEDGWYVVHSYHWTKVKPKYPVLPSFAGDRIRTQSLHRSELSSEV